MKLELWPGGPKIKNAPGVFPVGTDSVLLSDFAGRPGARRALDLGCGGGAVGILLAFANPALHVDCVDISAEAAALCAENAAMNALDDRVSALCGDIREYKSLLPPGSFDLAASNPPYFASGPVSASLPGARQELNCSLAELCRAAAWGLKNGGDLAVVHRPERLAELFAAMSAAGIEPKRLRCVSKRAGDAPGLILAEGRRGAKPGLKFLPPLALYDEAGAPSAELLRIYHGAPSAL